MDDMDRTLLAALRRDGRAGYSELAAELGITRATVRARMDRMAERGDIVGYTVVTKADVQTAPVRGLMMLGIEGRGAERARRQLLGIPQVQKVHSTNGRWDLIVEIGTETLAELDAVLRKLRLISGISGSETNLLLATPVSSRARLGS
mgnify:CR=1 FL=1